VFLDKNKLKNIFLFQKNHDLDFPTIVMVVKIEAIKDALFAIFSAKIVACPLKKKKVQVARVLAERPAAHGLFKKAQTFWVIQARPEHLTCFFFF
jgi:hypothetical protein